MAILVMALPLKAENVQRFNVGDDMAKVLADNDVELYALANEQSDLTYYIMFIVDGDYVYGTDCFLAKNTEGAWHEVDCVFAVNDSLRTNLANTPSGEITKCDISPSDLRDDVKKQLTEVFMRKDLPILDFDRVYLQSELDVQPEYPGGEEEMYKFLAEHIRYPIEAAKKGIKGRVDVEFTVKKDGTIDDVRALRTPSPLLSAEAVRVTKLMPKWIPGYKDGKPVSVTYVLPITFNLSRRQRSDF